MILKPLELFILLQESGNSTSTINYSFVDPSAPSGITVMYMLKQVDFDNTTELFGPVKIGADDISDVSIFPLPAKDNITIVGLNNENVYQVNVIDLVGQVILSTEVDANNSSIDVNSLRNGVYNVVVTNEYNVQISKRIIISK